MATNEKKSQDRDILDDLKKAEKIIKAQLLLKATKQLKELAKDILETKEECRMLLEEIGISEEDAKRVIDFVNELPETKLKEEDRIKIRNRVRQEVAKMRDDTEKKATDNGLSQIFYSQSSTIDPTYNYRHLANNITNLNDTSLGVTYTSSNGLATLTGSTGKNLNLKL